MQPTEQRAFPLSPEQLTAARRRIAEHARHTPLFTSSVLSSQTGAEVRLKAEMLQRTGSYKIRGALNKVAQLDPEQRARGVVCASAGNHAQGVALASAIHGVRAVVVMAENATPSKIAATKAYGAEVVLHGRIFDDAAAKARELVETEGLTFLHPFDDLDLIAGQATVGLEIVEDWPEVETVIVPIGGGGLISGIALAVKQHNPDIRVIGVESSDGPAMSESLAAGAPVLLEKVECVIDGLCVKRVGDENFRIVEQFVDHVVTLPDQDIFDAMAWVMHHAKLVVEGAAAAPVAALLHGLVQLLPGERTVCVLSGGNLDLSQLSGMRWN